MNSKNVNEKKGIDKVSLILGLLPLVGMIIGFVLFIYMKRTPDPISTPTPTIHVLPSPIIITVLVPYEITSTPIPIYTETPLSAPTLNMPLEYLSPTSTFSPTVSFDVLPTATPMILHEETLFPTPIP